MKRSMKQRSFGNSEMASIAVQCMQEIYHGRDVIAFLAGKGITDPVNEWYDIRRWIKSNKPDSYASIPMDLRLELPVHHDNPPGNKAAEVIIKSKESDETENQVKLHGNDQEGKKMEAANILESYEAVDVPKKRRGRKPKQKVDGETVVKVHNQREPEKEAKHHSKVTINSVTGEAATYEWDGSNIKITAEDGSVMTMEFIKLQEMLDELPEVIELLGR